MAGRAGRAHLPELYSKQVLLRSGTSPTRAQLGSRRSKPRRRCRTDPTERGGGQGVNIEGKNNPSRLREGRGEKQQLWAGELLKDTAALVAVLGSPGGVPSFNICIVFTPILSHSITL